MKKFVSMTLTVALMLSFFAIPASATSSSQLPDMSSYMALTDSGKISFDASSALQDGIDPEIVSYVQGNINRMNLLVDIGSAYITSDYRAVSRPTMNPFRAGGVTKYETDIWGNTLIYLNSDDTKQVIQDLENGDDIFGALSNIFGISGIFSDLYSLLTYVTIARLTAANEGNTGVVIQVSFDVSTGYQNILIWSQ